MPPFSEALPSDVDVDAKELFHIFLEGIADYAIFLLDAQGRIKRWPAAAEKVFGYPSEEMEGRPLACLYVKSDQELQKPSQELQMAAAHGRFEDVQWRLRRDGTSFWADSVICSLLDDRGTLRGYSCVVRDISERKKNEEDFRRQAEELAQARRLEAVGHLAGGVAHDFNNFMMGIICLTEEMHLKLEDRDPRRKELDEILGIAYRASTLTRDLLAFGKRQAFAPKLLALNAVLNEKRRIFSRLVGSAIELRISLDTLIGGILMDPTQLDQVMLNLMMNARDAMPQGGILSIRTGQEQIPSSADGPSGSYVTLTIEDNGTGIDPEALPHLFEPFFTTKEQGKGTGLGLASVYGIIQQNGGHISVESRLGQGAAFKIFFPEMKNPLPLEAPMAKKSVGGTATVLIVEDEDVIRQVVTRALKLSGYRVFSASLGEEALELGRRVSEPIHLLLTDVIMPGMNGHQLVDQFRALHPEAAILYMSAYSDTMFQPNGGTKAPMAFIEKPFNGETLTRKIQEVLQNE